MAMRSFNNVVQKLNFVEWIPAANRSANRVDSPAELGVPGALAQVAKNKNIISPRVGLSENNRKDYSPKRRVNPSVQLYLDNL